MDQHLHHTLSLFNRHLHIAVSKDWEDVVAAPGFIPFLSGKSPLQCDARLTCTRIRDVFDVPASVDVAMPGRGFRNYPILRHSFIRDMAAGIGPDVQTVLELERMVFFRPASRVMRAFSCGKSYEESRFAVDFFLFLFCGCLLALDRGLLLHAFGLVVDGMACAIAGPSGAGKSTAGVLMQKDWILADDFIGVTGIDARVLAHASPLSASRITDGPCRAPLTAIFFPVKSDRFAIAPVSPRDAFLRYLHEHIGYIGRLIGQYKPVYFELAHILFQKVPAYELHFTRDYIDTEAIKKVMKSYRM